MAIIMTVDYSNERLEKYVLCGFQSKIKYINDSDWSGE